MNRVDWSTLDEARAFSLNSFDAVEPSTTAILVIDLQRTFVEPGYPAYCQHAADIVPNANQLAAAVRKAGGLVVHTRHTTFDDPVRSPPPWQMARPELKGYFDSLRPGAAGQAIHPSVDVHPDDMIIDKARYSAFLPLSSSLDADLRARGIDTVIITGTITNICCESTARDAHMRGYRVFFIADATAAPTDAAHNATLAIMGTVFADVRTVAQMLPLITSAG